MNSAPVDSVQRIYSANEDNLAFGTGFLIHHDEKYSYYVTCAHVVEAVGRDRILDPILIGGEKASVVAKGSPDGPDDLAVLATLRQPKRPALLLIDGRQVDRPSPVQGVEKPIDVCGCTTDGTNYRIMPVRAALGPRGRCEGPSSSTSVDCWDLKNPDHPLEPGYSGAPVIDVESGRVFAVAVVANRSGGQPIGVSIAALPAIWGKQMPQGLLDIKGLFASDYNFKNSIRGKTSRVVRAFRISDGQYVALKIPLDPRDPALQGRLFTAARLAGRLRHPDIIHVHGIGKGPEDGYFLAMDLENGSSLQEQLEKEQISLGMAVKIAVAVSRAIQHANENRIVRGDLTPSKVLFTEDGRILVTGFGLAKELGQPGVDPRTDVHSLGRLLYWLLCGHAPDAERGVGATAHRFPPSPSRFRKEVPESLEAICLKCLRDDSAEPYRSAREVREALEHWQRGNVASAQGPEAVAPGVFWPVGRESEIETVVQALESGTNVAITGIAGVGKSTILDFAIRRLARRVPAYTVCHVRRLSQWRGEEGQNELLGKLITHVDTEAKLESARPEIRFNQAREMIRGRRIALAVDGADSKESQETIQTIRQELPALPIAVTSRNADWEGFEPVRVVGLPREDGVKLYKTKFGGIAGCEEAVAEICDRCGGHPMLITLLAVDAANQGCSPSEMLAYLKHGRIAINREIERRFDSVRAHLSKRCQRVFSVVGALDTTTIRSDLIKGLARVTGDDLKLMENQGLIRVHADGLCVTVHEFVRACSRDLMEREKESPRSLFRRTADLLANVTGLFARDPRLRIARYYLEFLRARRNGTPAKLAEIDGEWENILSLIDNLPHPRLVLALVDEIIGDHFDDPNGYVPRRRKTGDLRARHQRLRELADEVGGLLAARVEKNLGHFFYWHGDHDEAEPLFLRARERYEEAEDIAGIAATTWLLGYLADDENRYQDADTFYREGTRLVEQKLPEDTKLAAVGHHLIGCTLYHQGLFEKAREEFLAARDLVERSPDDHLLARIDRRLGSVALHLGDLDGAEKKLREVAQLVAKLERPRDAARIARHLGMVYWHRNKLEEAEEFLEQATKGFNDYDAPRGRGYTYLGWAMVRRKQERFAAAKQLCAKSLEIAKQTKSLYGEAAAYEEFANVLADEGAPTEEVYPKLRRARNVFTVIRHRRADALTERLKKGNAMDPNFPQPLEGVLFDLMDTLAYLTPGIYEHVQENMAGQLGVSLERFQWAWANSRKDASTGVFTTTEQRIRWVARTLGVPFSDDPVSSGMCRKMVAQEESLWRDNVKLYDGTVPLLKTVRRRGLRVAIVSNGPVAMACLAETLGLSDLVDQFVLSCQTGALKPQREIYEEALDRLGLETAHCVFVGDGNDRELDGAREVGLYTVKRKTEGCEHGYINLDNQSLDWDSEVDSLQELQSLFEPGSESDSA